MHLTLHPIGVSKRRRMSRNAAFMHPESVVHMLQLSKRRGFMLLEAHHMQISGGLWKCIAPSMLVLWLSGFKAALTTMSVHKL